MKEKYVRLNKFISEGGICSRREADRFIEQGNVIINGKKAIIGTLVKSGDIVKVNGIELEPKKDENLIFIALNKPKGITSTTEEGVKDNIVQFVNHSSRIFPIGRLDKDSQGLIFLTNDGDVVNKILRAGNNHEKEYLVTVDKPLSDQHLLAISKGVPMLGVVTKKCKISKETNTIFKITLIQGLNRQIRRMCEHFGYNVLKLERIRIMNIELKGLPLGEWRDLNSDELEILSKMLEHSNSNDKKNINTHSKKGKTKVNTEKSKLGLNNATNNKQIKGKPKVKLLSKDVGNNPDKRKKSTKKNTSNRMTFKSKGRK
ncbi:MAG: 23S rRNA pseudouridine(2604) synthase RluF [Flavobacteriia bacterium]|nr:23S rRNA pseudouridine(2604) synthase RluF [Flavobacteriia bacterium]